MKKVHIATLPDNKRFHYVKEKEFKEEVRGGINLQVM